jgi:NitT/TauT family transport system ATP-binding protein
MKVKMRLENVGHTYKGEREVQAIEEVSLDVYENAIFSIIGPSGCGKSTLLQIAAGFITPTKGKVYCDGKEVTSVVSIDRCYVFQESAVFPWMSVKENIEFPLLAKGVNPQKKGEVAEYYIKLVGLTGFENSLPKELSGGMLKRVELARAYAANPVVLLMDEPFGPLDAQTRATMQYELLRIWREAKKTLLFVTHDIEEAIFLSEYVVILSPRPAKIQKILKIDLPHPRRKETKLSPRFIELKREIGSEIGYF